MPRTLADKAVLLALVLMAAGLLVHLIRPGGLWRSPLEVEAFDAKQWQAAKAQERGPMAQDLLDSHLPVGLPRERVRSLLGEPNPSSSTRNGTTAPASAFTYPLGYWESLGYSTTNPQLTIHFDDQGLLHRARIDWD